MSDNKKENPFGKILSSLFQGEWKEYTPEEVLDAPLSPKDQAEAVQFQAYMDEMAARYIQKMAELTPEKRKEMLDFNEMVSQDALNIFKEKKPHFEGMVRTLGSVKHRSGNLNNYMHDIKIIVEELTNTAVHNPMAQMMLANDIWNQAKGVGFLADDMERFIRARGGIVSKWGSHFPPDPDFVMLEEPA